MTREQLLAAVVAERFGPARSGRAERWTPAGDRRAARRRETSPLPPAPATMRRPP